MITIEKYEELGNNGLLLDHYFLLCVLYRKQKLNNTKYIKGYLNLLEKKGYLENGILTDKGIKIIQDDIQVETIAEVQNTKDIPFSEWVEQLYKRCQDKLVELRGKKQVRDKVRGTSYSFLPNSTDLHKVLYKVFYMYKLKDRNVVEKCILNYIEKCHKQNSWFPVLQYYIFKDNKSMLVTDVESIDEPDDEQNVPDNSFKKIDTKELF